MPTKIEKDVVTGQETTAHEWDGLRELNTPLPKWWVYVLYATIAWAAVWFVLYPSVPWVNGYFHGVLGYSQRAAVNADVQAVVAQRAATMDRIAALSFAEIRKDPQLMAAAQTAGRIAFANNCQPCHAAGGGGQPDIPRSRRARGSGAARSMRSSRPWRTVCAAATPMRASRRCRASAPTAC